MTLINATTDHYLNFIKDDPVRPHLPMVWRISNGREVYVLENEEGEIRAMICAAYTKEVPVDEGELDRFSCEDGSIAVFYTVWSYAKGAGREIVLTLAKHIKETKIIDRYVTLSPQTEMARKFHLANGATVLQVNSTSVNYEYPREMI
jgi:hypothetical protein